MTWFLMLFLLHAKWEVAEEIRFTQGLNAGTCSMSMLNKPLMPSSCSQHHTISSFVSISQQLTETWGTPAPRAQMKNSGQSSSRHHELTVGQLLWKQQNKRKLSLCLRISQRSDKCQTDRSKWFQLRDKLWRTADWKARGRQGPVFKVKIWMLT